jgi:hypothetical protein
MVNQRVYEGRVSNNNNNSSSNSSRNHHTHTHTLSLSLSHTRTTTATPTDLVVRGGGEERLVAHGAVPLEGLLDALVALGGHGEGDAGVARHAVAEVHAQALPQPADVAVGAVVDGLARVVVVEAADAAVVRAEGQALRAARLAPAVLRGGLHLPAAHAADLLHRVPVHRMIRRRLVVAEAARVEAPAARRPQLARAAVVPAPQLPRRRVRHALPPIPAPAPLRCCRCC